MSHKVSSLVWDNFNRGGSEKLVMLAFANWSNDEGGSIFPSISAIAKKINTSECQARRIVHKLIEEGFLVVVGNHEGGKPGQSRLYKMNLKVLETPITGATRTPSASNTCTPSADESRTASTHARDGSHRCAIGASNEDFASTPSTDATRTPSTSATRTASTHAREGSHPCTRGLAPMLAYPSLSVKEPSRACKKRKVETLAPEKFEVNPEMVEWAISEGIPEDEIKFQTEKFLDRNKSEGKGYKDWNAAWRNWMRKYVEFNGKRKTG